MPDVISGKVTYASYTPGTTAFATAVENDYWAGLITLSQRESLLYGPGSVPKPAAVSTRWWPTLAELGNAANIAISSWAKYSQIEYQEELKKFQLEQARFNLARGMMGEAEVNGYGGLNIWTLVMFGGVAALALFLLKK